MYMERWTGRDAADRNPARGRTENGRSFLLVGNGTELNFLAEFYEEGREIRNCNFKRRSANLIRTAMGK